jgi:virginiamycin A acetyltransferase
MNQHWEPVRKDVFSVDPVHRLGSSQLETLFLFCCEPCNILIRLIPTQCKGFPRFVLSKIQFLTQILLLETYTYSDDPEDSENFERNVLYHFPFIGDKLIIGKFCALARGITFIMNGANHNLSGFSTYPFEIFGQGWDSISSERSSGYPVKGDTIVGHDVWIGYEAVILPGIQVGDGVIIAAKSVVTRDVNPYTIVGGNPENRIRYRLSEEIIQKLLEIAWWHWDPEKITRNLKKIVAADIKVLRNCR